MGYVPHPPPRPEAFGLHLTYSDPADEADMMSGAVPCDAEAYLAVLHDMGLTAGHSRVMFGYRSRDGRRLPFIPQAPPARRTSAPTLNTGTR